MINCFGESQNDGGITAILYKKIGVHFIIERCFNSGITVLQFVFKYFSVTGSRSKGNALNSFTDYTTFLWGEAGKNFPK